MKSPLAALAVCFALGIFFARPEYARGLSVAFLLAAAGVCLLAGLLFLRTKWWRTSSLFTLAGFVAAGAAAGPLFECRFPPNHVSRLAALGVDLDDPVRLEGVVASTPQPTSYGLQFDVEVRRAESRRYSHDLTGKVRLRVQASDDPEVAAVADSLHLQYGDSIRALVRLRKPRIYQNPGSFDFRRWMESIEDLTWVGTIKNPLLVEKLPHSNSFRLATLLERTRHRLLQSIDGLYSPWSAQGRYGAVLKAVLWGDRSTLNSETIENFRKTGLYHLLVIAGLHVGLLALLARFLLRLFPLGESARTGLLLLFLLGYAALVEQRAPTLRATIMISVYLLARLLYRGHSSLNAIGFAALVLLFHRPVWLFESGFQLSFAAALLIAGLAVPIVERTTEPYRRALWKLNEVSLDAGLAPKQAQFRLDVRALIAGLRARARFLDRHPSLAAASVRGPIGIVLWAANLLLFSAVLQLGLLLPMAETFHRVTFAGIGLNALAIPVMTVLLGLALPTVILGAIVPALAVWPAKVLALVMAALFALTDLPRLPAWLSYRVPEPSSWVAWGFAGSVILAAFVLGRRRRTLWATLAAGAIFIGLISFHPFAPRLPRGILEVNALDCGQGDALFLVFPNRTTMLVDAGGSRARGTREGAFQGRRWDPGEDIVSPYLWSKGIKKIDILVLSHAHEDHLGGLPAVVGNFQIGEFWHGRNPATPEFLALLDQVRQRRIPTRVLGAGDVITRGGTSVRVLWPPPTRWPSRVPSNDDSLVIRITCGATSLLLPGDISGSVEQELMTSAGPLASQVLKVAHHGSKSSSSPAFIARVAPRVALVTAEYGGFVNLPSPETLTRLRAAGSRILRTDLDGAITVKMKGSSLAVRHYGGASADSATGEAGTQPVGAESLSVP